MTTNSSTMDPLLTHTNVSKLSQPDMSGLHTFVLGMRKAYDRVWHTAVLYMLLKKAC